MIIVGAGLAGLLAAHAWPTARLVELSPEPRNSHAALLRFRSDGVARLVGIDFRRVRVRKGVWEDGRFVFPDIRLANLYSSKILSGRIADRSIWSVEPVDRWVAPETLYEELLESVRQRIGWGVPFDWVGRSCAGDKRPVVSTAPMSVTAAVLSAPAQPLFEREPILVQRFRVPRCDVHQTIYFPTHAHSVYRASLTGSLLIVEHAGATEEGPWLGDVFPAFAIEHADPLGEVTQSFGKIAPIPDADRKRILFHLTHEHGIYSLGRFATWRNILLDDVVDDIAVIKRLLRTADAYDARRAAAG